MGKEYRIHPKIGIARVGNSPTEFYIGPEKTGGLPIECDPRGNPVLVDGVPKPVRKFKDIAGAIKRQAARFKIFEYDKDNEGREISLQDGNVKEIRWTVHVANKKAIWYEFSELRGDLMFGPENSYEEQHIAMRNANLIGKGRQSYIIDPGPRTVNKPKQKVPFSRYNIPATYPFGSFPPSGLNPQDIDTLGEIMMDDAGRLLFLGGFGSAGGTGGITSFAGTDGWWDDVSDGFVLATIVFKDGRSIDLEPAWIIVGSPKYAPELINIITLDDCIFDTSVRGLNYDKKLYDKKKFPNTYEEGGPYNPFAGFNPDYKPNYKRDIEPIIVRPQSYRWVANVPAMIDFSRPSFDTTDPSEANKKNRMEYFQYFRVPVPPEYHKAIHEVKNGPNQLFHPDGLPLMPLNSGDNSVTNYLIYKFLTLTLTQYFFMYQWALGKFTTGNAKPDDRRDVTPLDREVVGNCVGGPYSPGIEVTWLMRNPVLYSSPYAIRIAHFDGSNVKLQNYYRKHGLSVVNDPQDGIGAEPGDLTKRMAVPWQADFFDCAAQTPNISDPAVNQTPSGTEVPPAYYVYWWPPQSPMFVMAGSLDPAEQVLDGYVTNPSLNLPDSDGVIQAVSGYEMVAAGQEVNYQRGVYSFSQMIASWADMGFIVNQATDRYPYFVEKERNTVLIAQGTATGTK